MNYTNVDADRVLAEKAQIANDISNIRRSYNILKTQILSALTPYWQGRAYDVFALQYNAFLETLDSFSTVCEALNTEVGKAAKNYNGADAEVRRLVNGLPD
jgi:uncharacterized protein YukE